MYYIIHAVYISNILHSFLICIEISERKTSFFRNHSQKAVLFVYVYVFLKMKIISLVSVG